MIQQPAPAGSASQHVQVHLLGGYDPVSALAVVKTHGAVILRDPRGTLEEFVALTDALTDSLPHHSVATRERDPVAGAPDVATVNKGTDPIPLHRESSFLPSQPDLLAFYCQRPPASAGGGQTTLCDGVRLLAALPPPARQFAETEILTWRFSLPRERWTVALGTESPKAAAQRIKELMARTGGRATYTFSFPEGPGGCLDGTYRAPLVLPTFWDREPAFANSLLGYYYRQRGPLVASHLHHVALSGGRPFPPGMLQIIRNCAEELTWQTDWQAGDVVLVDNSHVMHGRRAVTDSRRTILVRLGNYRAELTPRAAPRPGR